MGLLIQFSAIPSCKMSAGRISSPPCLIRWLTAFLCRAFVGRDLWFQDEEVTSGASPLQGSLIGSRWSDRSALTMPCTLPWAHSSYETNPQNFWAKALVMPNIKPKINFFSLSWPAREDILLRCRLAVWGAGGVGRGATFGTYMELRMKWVHAIGMRQAMRWRWGGI